MSLSIAARALSRSCSPASSISSASVMLNELEGTGRWALDTLSSEMVACTVFTSPIAALLRRSALAKAESAGDASSRATPVAAVFWPITHVPLLNDPSVVSRR